MEFHYNFGFKGDFEEMEENVKEAISDYFDSRDDVALLEFVGNPSPPPGDVMRVKAEASRSNGYDVIEELKNRQLDYGVYIIQGGPD